MKFNRKEQYTQNQYNTMRTAFLTAYPKIFTDIPYAGMIFIKTIPLAYEQGFIFQPEQFGAKLAVELEARHKALNKSLRKHIKKYDNNVVVVEIGIGLSSRKLEFFDTKYIEIDYSPMIEIKQKIYNELNISVPINDFIKTDLNNIKDLDLMVSAIKGILSNRKIIFISEGLFWYLSRSNVQNLVNHVYELIALNGGLWITGDCPTLQDKFIDEEYRGVIAKSSERKMDEPFSSFLDFKNFFGDLGFYVRHSKLEKWINVKNLITANLFSLSVEETINRLRAYTDIAEISLYEKQQ